MTDALPGTLRGRFDELLGRLARASMAVSRKPPRRMHGDSHMCCCPAHDDKNPSLSVTIEGQRILLHCFAGCAPADVIAAIGMPWESLFDDYQQQERRQPQIRWNGSSASANAAVELEQEAFDDGAVLRASEPPPRIRDFLDMEFPPIVPLLGPIATQQLIILYALPGAGKTMLALALAWAIASGTDFIGWRSARRARVLVVDGEMAGEMMQARLAAAGSAGDYLRIANLPNWASAAGYGPLNLAEEVGQAVVDTWASVTASEVIVLDNLMSLAWIDGVSMNSDEFWAPIRRFCVWQRSLGRTVIVVDHSNKSGGLHGTGTKLWHADLAIGLKALEDGSDLPSGFELKTPDKRVSMEFVKVRAGGEETEEKILTIEAVGQAWGHEQGREEKRRRAREMKENGLSIREIAEELGSSKSTIGRWVR